MRKRIVAGVLGAAAALSMALPAWADDVSQPGPSPISPGIGLCAPLPDPPLIADWTAKFLEVVIGGDWHRQPCGA